MPFNPSLMALLLAALLSPLPAQTPDPNTPPDNPAPVTATAPNLLPEPDPSPIPATPPSPPLPLRGFASLPPRTQELIRAAYQLDARGLGYRYGSADPAQGGMDCSGSVQYLLKTLGWKQLPRASDGFYRWIWQAGTFKAVNGSTFESFEWAQLQPGDLLFWTGTYEVQKNRDPAISHVMIYLGQDEKSGRRLMFGASEGRRYLDQTKNGVGIFDFILPRPQSNSSKPQPRFIGYGRLPAQS
ncbi:MAG: C40 family peptidase [Blastochloris sp.]|nr:C40 family peptidase [Blastochloris sp.]